MQKNRLIALAGALAFSLLLGGCDTASMKLTIEQQNAQIEQQQKQIALLQNKIDDLKQMHDEQEKLATEFNACESLGGVMEILCPAQVLERGAKAAQEGYAGGGIFFYSLVAAKLAVPLILGMVAYFGLTLGWLRLIRPERKKIKAAKDVIEQSEARARAAEARAERADSQKARIETEAEQARRDLTQLHEQIDTLRGELDELQRERDEKKRDLDLLDGFS
jgi:phage-related minor tail protein